MLVYGVNTREFDVYGVNTRELAYGGNTRECLSMELIHVNCCLWS